MRTPACVLLCLIQPDTGHLSEPYFSVSRDIYRANYFISTIPSFNALKGLLPYADMYSCVISWWWAMSRPKHVETNFKWNIYLIVASSWRSHLSLNSIQTGRWPLLSSSQRNVTLIGTLWQADSSSASQEIPRVLCYPTVHFPPYRTPCNCTNQMHNVYSLRTFR